MKPVATPEYLTLEQLAVYSGMSINTLRNWKASGMPYYKLGRSIRVKRGDFDAWALQFKASGTDQQKPEAISAWDRVFK